MCRAVDANGDVLDILAQRRRDARVALRFLRKLMKRWGRPRVLVTDKLGSYAKAPSVIAPGVDRRRLKGLNNRSGASHRHTRRREKALGGFKSTGQAQRLMSAHDRTCALFRPHRRRFSAASCRHARPYAFGLWRDYTAELRA
jgi:putative transposase